MRARPFRILLGVQLLTRQSAGVAAQVVPDDLPIVQLRLAPPKHPHREVSAEIRRLDLDRERAEASLQARLRGVYETTLSQAKAKIQVLAGATLRSPISSSIAIAFLQKASSRSRDASFAMSVSVLPPHVPDPSIRVSLEQLESKRAKIEEQLFRQAEAEMGALTSIVLDELGRALASHALDSQRTADLKRSAPQIAFLQLGERQRQALPAAANVRVAAAAMGFPRIADLIEDMQRRRDRAESAERAQILEMELSLVSQENEAIKAAILYRTHA